MEDIERYRLWHARTIKYLGGKCVKCGSVKNLEFDHINPKEKLFTLTNGWGMANKAKLQREIDKCQLLCNSCHKEKSSIEHRERGLARGFTHGKYHAFAKKKCTCDTCEKGKLEYYQQRNSRRRTSEGPRGQYGLPAEHGTYKRYKRGCKCVDCKAANAAKKRELTKG